MLIYLKGDKIYFENILYIRKELKKEHDKCIENGEKTASDLLSKLILLINNKIIIEKEKNCKDYFIYKCDKIITSACENLKVYFREFDNQVKTLFDLIELKIKETLEKEVEKKILFNVKNGQLTIYSLDESFNVLNSQSFLMNNEKSTANFNKNIKNTEMLLFLVSNALEFEYNVKHEKYNIFIEPIYKNRIYNCISSTGNFLKKIKKQHQAIKRTYLKKFRANYKFTEHKDIINPVDNFNSKLKESNIYHIIFMRFVVSASSNKYLNDE